MSTRSEGTRVRLDGMLGADPRHVGDRLGPPAGERAAGEDRWVVYALAGARLRIRIGSIPGRGARVRSWTVTFERGHPSLEAACSALGIRPDPPHPADGRPARSPEGTAGLLRRAYTDPRSGRVDSLTARMKGGAVVSVTAFDEPPEWR